MPEALIPATDWRRAHWPVHDRTLRRAELDPDDPFPITRINGRKYVRASEADAWLRRRAAREADRAAQRETDELVAEAQRTGRSIDALYAERRAG